MKAINVHSKPGQIVHNKSLEDDCGKLLRKLLRSFMKTFNTGKT